ncbi:IS1096 element passenger TnpR family protein [Lignipirellula cremea]|uniref:LexA repressor n=1 Tax=Lignipirellula cremea TaxID=2528010 RepID=A0A518DL05_9BACT|nr:helix-turn-helix domain-containing protein [Lignipirellula cremea]QDU92511.1 LexA repressor [Lignipirellula cremea]
MSDFTPTQGRYLAYIHRYIEGFGLPPAESEIAEAVGVSPPSVNQMMKTLEKKGLIRRQPGVARSIEILIDPDTLPPWKGKRITRTVTEWVRVRPPAESLPADTKVYRLKITLRGASPPIWRRIETTDVTLGKLHELIQTAMGWTNSHLHQFEVGDLRLMDSRLFMDDFQDLGAMDYAGVRLSHLLAPQGSKKQLIYLYDFGDGWEHKVTLEAVSLVEPGVSYPRCTGGKRACPPEDVGGVWGFVDFVAAVTDPDHSEHDAMLEWYGPFDPAAFDPKEATQQMKEGLPEW